LAVIFFRECRSSADGEETEKEGAYDHGVRSVEVEASTLATPTAGLCRAYATPSDLLFSAA
jgi:hypothetical protein